MTAKSDSIDAEPASVCLDLIDTNVFSLASIVEALHRIPFSTWVSANCASWSIAKRRRLVSTRFLGIDIIPRDTAAMDVSTGEMLLTVEAYELSVDPTTITASSTSTSTSTEAADLNLGSGQPPVSTANVVGSSRASATDEHVTLMDTIRSTRPPNSGRRLSGALLLAGFPPQIFRATGTTFCDLPHPVCTERDKVSRSTLLLI